MVRLKAKDCGEKAERREEEAKARAQQIPFGNDNKKSKGKKQ
jgi:hypothetical protein